MCLQFTFFVIQIKKSGGLGSKNFLFGDLNLKQRNRKRICNATVREKGVRDILFSTRDGFDYI